VWELDAAGFASFVDALPEPFGIGRVLLEDGTDVAGVLCEAVAVEGAPDVTHLGGWRAYRATQPVRRARPHSRPGRAG
jgi:allophanate hydrolase